MSNGTQWPQLPENVIFDAFDDEDQILDFILALDSMRKKIFLDALDKSKGENVVLYSKTPVPSVHIVLMKFTLNEDGGLVLMLSRSESQIYSHFERLKEENPKDVDVINHWLSIVREQIRVANEDANNKKK